MNQAYMIRNDGMEFPVEIHVYGNEEDFRSSESLDYVSLSGTADAAAWLYNATKSSVTKRACVDFLSLWIDWCTMAENRAEAVEQFPKMVTDGDIYLSSGSPVLALLKSDPTIFYKTSRVDDDSLEDEVNTLGQLVCRSLDQEFLRARIGGVYNSVGSSNDAYFRISSVGFDWLPVISKFVYKYKLSTVSICRDLESTGNEGVLSHKGESIWQMPLSDFITLSGTPVFESFYKRFVGLNEGKTILEAFSNMNRHRILERLKVYSIVEMRNYSTPSDDRCLKMLRRGMTGK